MLPRQRRGTHTGAPVVNFRFFVFGAPQKGTKPSVAARAGTATNGAGSPHRRPHRDAQRPHQRTRHPPGTTGRLGTGRALCRPMDTTTAARCHAIARELALELLTSPELAQAVGHVERLRRAPPPAWTLRRASRRHTRERAPHLRMRVAQPRNRSQPPRMRLSAG